MSERPYPWEDVDMDMVWGRDTEGRYYARCCCDWFTSSPAPSQVSDAVKAHIDGCTEALLAGIEQQNILERILNAESPEEINAIYEEDGDPPPDPSA